MVPRDFLKNFGRPVSAGLSAGSLGRCHYHHRVASNRRVARRPTEPPHLHARRTTASYMANLPGVSHATPESGLTSASPMDRGNDALSTHTLPVQAQPFSMNDHTSQHYHAVDALSSDVLPATRERLSPAEAQPKPPSTKRRKINTCFPCKQRKVKCDRQQPYCGQCQKHRIPAERCVWSTDMAPVSYTHLTLPTKA